jgi:hypothetical protein
VIFGCKVSCGISLRFLPLEAVQRGTALLTTATNACYIEQNFDISTLPEDAIKEVSEGISTRVRLNPVVETGVPGFIPRRS